MTHLDYIESDPNLNLCPLFIHQEYLFENSRIDNIFTDQYYETFTSALHEVVNDFKLPVNELGYFVTRSVSARIQGVPSGHM